MTNTKKKNGNKRKLLGAVGMLTVSAAMLVSSTFAWFSMNKTVQATSMQVSAKSDSTYLLIHGTETTATGIQSANLTNYALTVADEEALLIPSSPALTEAEVGYLTTSGKVVGTDAAITTAGVLVDNPTKAATVTNWFTANALGVGAADIDTTTARQLSTFNGYVIRKTLYLTVASGSNPANNLKVTPNFEQKTGGTDLTAAKMVVTTSDGGFAVLTSAQNGTEVDIKGTNTNLTDNAVLTVNLYIYYDGDEAPVYTNNMGNLKGANMGLTFAVEPVTT